MNKEINREWQVTVAVCLPDKSWKEQYAHVDCDDMDSPPDSGTDDAPDVKELLAAAQHNIYMRNQHPDMVAVGLLSWQEITEWPEEQKANG